MANDTGAVTLRGRFAPGDKVELVGGEFPDPMLPDAEKTATVSADGEVTFSGLTPGRTYVVRDKDRTRQATITARADKPVESSLIAKPDLSPLTEQPQTPVEPVPQVVHHGARGTRQLTSTRGDAFAGEAQGDEGRLSKPGDVADPSALRQADFAGAQMSDTPIGQATPVVEEETEVAQAVPHPDPVTEAAERKPGSNVVKQPSARQATPEEVQKAVKPRKASARKASARKRTPAKKATKSTPARKRTSKRSK